MIKYSLIIKNRKNEMLICGNEDSYYEFPGVLLFNDFSSEIDIQYFLELYIKNVIGITIDNIIHFETFYYFPNKFKSNDLDNVHCILLAKLKSGNPRKMCYKKMKWVNVGDLENYDFYSLEEQTLQKIGECSYCLNLMSRKNELDEFFHNYFEKSKKELNILESFNEEITDSLEKLLIEKELVHLRAFLFENAKNKNNITIQNYFLTYRRNDLVDEINDFLSSNTAAGVTIRSLIKTAVDENIAHYDSASEESIKIYEWCLSAFSKNGVFPLNKFIPLINGYIMSLIVEMWYDAGEMGVLMSDRNISDKQRLYEYRNTCKDEVIKRLN